MHRSSIIEVEDAKPLNILDKIFQMEEYFLQNKAEELKNIKIKAN